MSRSGDAATCRPESQGNLLSMAGTVGCCLSGAPLRDRQGTHAGAVNFEYFDVKLQAESFEAASLLRFVGAAGTASA